MLHLNTTELDVYVLMVVILCVEVGLIIFGFVKLVNSEFYRKLVGTDDAAEADVNPHATKRMRMGHGQTALEDVDV